EVGDPMDIQLMTDGGADLPKRLRDIELFAQSFWKIGGADLPKRLREELDVAIVPLYLHFEDGEYKSGVTIDLPTFLKKVRETKKLPQSSAPSPNDFYEAYKKVEPDKPILMLSMTKVLS